MPKSDSRQVFALRAAQFCGSFERIWKIEPFDAATSETAELPQPRIGPKVNPFEGQARFKCGIADLLNGIRNVDGFKAAMAKSLNHTQL
jgi:hypothetical protein